MQKRALLTAAVLLGAAVNIVAAQSQLSDEMRHFLDMQVESGKMTVEERASYEASYAAKVTNANLGTRIDEMVASMNSVQAVSSDYKVGRGFTWRSGDHSLTIGGALQSRFSFQNRDDSGMGGFANNNENAFGFSVPRARLIFSGVAFKDWGFEVDFDVSNVTDTNANTSSFLRDAFVNWQKHTAFQVKFGQFKTPVGRQFLTEFSELQFVDRAFANNSLAFRPGRDLGIQVHGRAGGDKGDLFSYAFGIFNGEGEGQDPVSPVGGLLVNVGNNDDEGFLYAGRVMISPFGGADMMGEGDHRSDSGARDFILQVGVNAWYETNDATGGEDPFGIGADVAIYFEGLSALVQFDYSEDETGVEAWALLVQGGYMVVPGQFEIVGRFSYFETDVLGSNATLDGFEIGGGVNYFIAGNSAKVQLDVLYVDADGITGVATNPLGIPGSGFEDVIIRIQFQLLF